MSSDKSFFGHPRGLATLFFTEMWERFSYYGMRALLLLYMVAAIKDGGMGLDDRTGTSIYALYTMLVYLLALPGGWLADKFFGLRKAVFYGGCLITLGHICLALPFDETFFLGLLLIVMGTGLLKPNVSSLVGELYPANEGARRDSGFSIFFMGINLGATIGPLIVSYLGEDINWHYGFAAAAVGMFAGLVQYKLTERYLGDVGLHPSRLENPEKEASRRSNISKGLWVTMLVLFVFVLLLFTRVIIIDPFVIAKVSAYIIGGTLILYFLYLFLFENLSSVEKQRIVVVGILFVFSALFYAAFEQQGSSLNLFAERYTDRMIFGWEMPTGFLQSVPPIFVIIFAPVFAWLWIWLSKRNINPSTPVKFSLGLIFLGIGFAIMIGAAQIVVHHGSPLPTWLTATYLFHEFGEICLYPVGLSAVTKLSPQRLVGQMMGVWFMSLAFGNLIAGLFAGEFDKEAIAANPHLLTNLFLKVTIVILSAGIIILLLNKPIKKLMHGIR